MVKKIKLDASSLRSHLGYRMRIVSNAVSHSFAKKLAIHGVTVAEWVVLREMFSVDESTSQSKIADITGLTRGAISKLVDRLLQKGLVTRTESSEDRRFQDIELTPDAFKLVPKLALVADQNDDAFFSVLSKVDRKVLTEILIRLADLHKLNVNPIE